MDEGTSFNEMNIMGYLKIFFRRKELIIIPAFFGLVLGLCAGMILPKEYISSTKLLVEEGKTDNPLFDKLTVSTTVSERIENIRESMLGWNSLVRLVRVLKLDTGVKNAKQLEGLVLGIRNKIKIKLIGKNIIDLSYIDRSPETAQSIVKNITEIFIERNLEIQSQETSDAILFMEEQLKLYKSKIKSAEIAQLKDELSTLLVDSTEAHPKVKELRDQIAAKEEELKAENLEYTDDNNLESATTNNIIKDIQKALDTIEGGSSVSLKGGDTIDSELAKVMLITKMDNVMARDVNVNTQIYNSLLQRLETAKITQRLQTSKEGTKYTVLDPPRLPLSPSKPNKMLVALGGLFFGLLVGGGLVIGSELLDKSFIDVEEANRYFGTPLLGAISKINTIESIRLAREKNTWLYSMSAIAGVILIILTTVMTLIIK